MGVTPLSIKEVWHEADEHTADVMASQGGCRSEHGQVVAACPVSCGSKDAVLAHPGLLEAFCAVVAHPDHLGGILCCPSPLGRHPVLS